MKTPNHSKSFGVSRAELERYFIKEYGLPEDIIITGFTKIGNQAGYVVEIDSKTFPETPDIHMTEVSLLKKGN